MGRNRAALALALALVATAAACAHMARIDSDPPGAEVYVDGVQVGLTPFQLEDTPGSGKRYEIAIRKPGYKLVQASLVQERFSWPRGIAAMACGTCTLGLGCLGLFWAWQLEDLYNYKLEPVAGAAASQPFSLPPPAVTN